MPLLRYVSVSSTGYRWNAADQGERLIDPSSCSVQPGLCATSQGWPSGSTNTREYPPQKVSAAGREIVAPAVRASAMTASTSCADRTLCASVTPPQR